MNKPTIKIFNSIGEWISITIAVIALTLIILVATILVVGVPAAVVIAFPLVFYRLLILFDSHAWAITVLALCIFGVTSLVSSISHAWVAKQSVEKVIMYRYSNYNLIIMLGLMLTTVVIVYLAYK